MTKTDTITALHRIKDLIKELPKYEGKKESTGRIDKSISHLSRYRVYTKNQELFLRAARNDLQKAMLATATPEIRSGGAAQ